VTNATNASRFNRELADAIGGGIRAEMESFAREITLEALSRIVDRTPVDEGIARGNWQATIGAPSEAVLERDDPTGRAAKTEGKATINGWALADGSMYVANNLPYINVLEEGGYPNPPKRGSRIKDRDLPVGRRRERIKKSLDVSGVRYIVKSAGGFSLQAPLGMVGVTVNELQDVSRRI
jgi:hypothetical protein